MSFTSPRIVSPTDPIQPRSGKPVLPEDINVVIRKLTKRVDALETQLTRLARPGAGITFTSPDGLTQKTLTIDNTGSPVWS